MVEISSLEHVRTGDVVKVDFPAPAGTTRATGILEANGRLMCGDEMLCTRTPQRSPGELWVRKVDEDGFEEITLETVYDTLHYLAIAAQAVPFRLLVVPPQRK